MKILLIKPKWFVHGGIYRYLEDVQFTPLHIAIIASLSKGHEVTLIDNDWEDIPYNERFDLVGITVTTFTSERAYDIANRFKGSGAKVVLGGVHPTLLPEECLKHCDSVVVGEAEYIWKEVLEDIENGSLRKIYRNLEPVDMNDVPFPRRDLLKEDYRIATVQATRGCPNSCKFCYLPNMPWRVYRKRDVNLVYEELRQLKQEMLFFVDDNLFADEDYVMELCEKIAPLKKVWSVQAPMNIAYNERMLKKMRDAGCFHVQIGFQTINPKSLEWAGIVQNRIEEYKFVIDRLHRHNMLVVGFFIFGFDYDDRNVFARTQEVIKEIDIDDICLYILTPYPGTEIYDRLKKEKRLLVEKDRSNYGWANAVFVPNLMSPEELEDGVQNMYHELYGHFKKRAPLKILRRLGMLIRYPHLLRLLIAGIFRKVNIVPASCNATNSGRLTCSH